MKTPNYLQKGDAVGILSTARKVDPSELDFALKLLKKWELKPVLGKTIGAEENQFAGSDDFRAKDFQDMMDNPEIKAIWCARGGYGTIRMADKLDFSDFVKNPKWIIGYSDITVLHVKLHQLEMASIHAQMPVQIETKTEASAASLRAVLFGEKYGFRFESKQTLLREGKVTAPLVGGNLSVLYSICGSSSALKTEGKILFIEDLDEYLYHIDRMMMNLKRNGMLENLAALVVGGMTDMHDNAIPFGKTAEEIIWDAVKEYDFPVCFNVPAGHISDNRALIFGQELSLTISKENIEFEY